MKMESLPLEEVSQIQKIYLFPCNYEIAPFLFRSTLIFKKKKLEVYKLKSGEIAVLTGVGRKNIISSLNALNSQYDLKKIHLALKGFCGALNNQKIFSAVNGSLFLEDDSDGGGERVLLKNPALKEPPAPFSENIFITINYFADKKAKIKLKEKYSLKFKDARLFCDMESFYFVQYALKNNLQFSVKKIVIDNIKSFVPSGAYLQKLRSFKSMPIKNKIFTLTNIKGLTAFLSLFVKMRVYFLKALLNRKRYLQNG